MGIAFWVGEIALSLSHTGIICLSTDRVSVGVEVSVCVHCVQEMLSQLHSLCDAFSVEAEGLRGKKIVLLFTLTY